MVPSLLCTFVAHITFLHVFFLPPPFILSLSCFLFLSLSLFSLSLSLYLSPLFLSVVVGHMSSDALYEIFSSWSILPFFTPNPAIAHINFTNHSPTIFYDYHTQRCLKNVFFRSWANRRLVICTILRPKKRIGHSWNSQRHSKWQKSLKQFSKIGYIDVANS